MLQSFFCLSNIKHTRNGMCTSLYDDYYLHFDYLHLYASGGLLLNKTERNYKPFKSNYRQVCMSEDKTLVLWFKKEGCKVDFKALLTFFMSDLNNDLIYVVYAGNEKELLKKSY